MNSREATFDGANVVVELKAMPIPIPKINTPPRIAMVVKLNRGDWKTEGLEVVADLLVGLRLIVA